MTSETDLAEHRRELLIPATFGVHSNIHNDLRDYISRSLWHSTFSFHEVFLNRPAMWWERFEDVIANNTGTTEPFLSRFVHQSGLAPKANLNTMREFREKLHGILDKKVQKHTKDAEKKELERFILEIPMVATAEGSYHKDLEKLAFTLNDSIVLRGLLKIWLALGGGGDFEQDRRKHGGWPAIRRVSKRGRWNSIEEWKGGAFGDWPPTVDCAARGSTRPLSVIGRLDPDRVKEIYGKAIIGHLKKAIDDGVPDKKESPDDEKALALLREYQIALRPLMQDSTKPPIWIGVSISSDALFWGECVVLLPGHSSDFDEAIRRYEGVARILSEKVQTTFMPIMTIFESYLLEHRLKQGWSDFKKDREQERGPCTGIGMRPANSPFELPLDFLSIDTRWTDWATNKNLSVIEQVGMGHEAGASVSTKAQVDKLKEKYHGDNLFLSIVCECLNSGSWMKKLNDLERTLASLWAARFAVILKNLPVTVGKINPFLDHMKKIEESLVFENYLMSSPAILKSIREAMKIRHGERGIGKPSVKTALVVGGPGSGKDSMAKLVRLFSPGYRFGELITLNMAAFRPKEAAVPLLLGLNIHHQPSFGTKWTLSISSMLGRAWEKVRKLNGEEPFKKGQGMAFIFDELNSLDIDTQGALLRFLEGGELLALGEVEDKTTNVDALVIGVMNEDPDSITKARTLDRVLRDKQVFGGMLGDFIYELFRGQRRLRDDLYFRMARGGKIVLPELRDRREDIPILFHFIVKKELMPSIQNRATGKPKLHTELSTYEELMNRSLEWQGNVRELQALARSIFETAVDDYNIQIRTGKIDKESPLTLRGAHVRIAQQIHASQTRSEVLVHPT